MMIQLEAGLRLTEFLQHPILTDKSNREDKQQNDPGFQNAKDP